MAKLEPGRDLQHRSNYGVCRKPRDFFRRCDRNRSSSRKRRAGLCRRDTNAIVDQQLQRDATGLHADSDRSGRPNGYGLSFAGTERNRRTRTKHARGCIRSHRQLPPAHCPYRGPTRILGTLVHASQFSTTRIGCGRALRHDVRHQTLPGSKFQTRRPILFPFRKPDTSQSCRRFNLSSEPRRPPMWSPCRILIGS
jgi:hypothetical protein